MKRIIFVLLIGISCLTGSTASAEGQQQQAATGAPYPKVQVKIEGACDGGVCGEGYKINSTSYVPIRVVLESMGAKVEWDEKSQTATIIRPSESRSEKNEAYEAYVEDTLYLYEEIEKELENLTLLEYHFNLMHELYEEFNDKVRYEVISKDKLKNHQKAMENIEKKLQEYQEKYKNQNPDILELIKVTEEIDNIINLYQWAADTFEKYMTSNNVQFYKNSLLYRTYALDKIESVRNDLSELKY